MGFNQANILPKDDDSIKQVQVDDIQPQLSDTDQDKGMKSQQKANSPNVAKRCCKSMCISKRTCKSMCHRRWARFWVTCTLILASIFVTVGFATGFFIPKKNICSKKELAKFDTNKCISDQKQLEDYNKSADLSACEKVF